VSHVHRHSLKLHWYMKDVVLTPIGLHTVINCGRSTGRVYTIYTQRFQLYISPCYFFVVNFQYTIWVPTEGLYITSNVCCYYTVTYNSLMLDFFASFFASHICTYMHVLLYIFALVLTSCGVTAYGLNSIGLDKRIKI